jgi:hypothetical protein
MRENRETRGQSKTGKGEKTQKARETLGKGIPFRTPDHRLSRKHTNKEREERSRTEEDEKNK